MYHPDYSKALELVSEIHKKNKLSINTSTKDVKLAVYYLQGGCITQAKFAIKSWMNGDLNTPLRAKRFIDECKLLIFCLITVDGKDRKRYLKQFFNDEIVTIKPKKHEKDILERTNMDKSFFDIWLKHGETLSHGFSKGVHPNLKAVAYNSDIDTGEYDYDAINFSCYPIENFDFAHYVVIPAIDSVIISSGIFGVKEEDLKEIFELREKIQINAKRNLGK